MTNDLIYQEIEEILIAHLNLKKELLTPDARLREDLGLDSIAMVNLQVAIEDRFDIRFDPVETDLTNVFKTIGSITNHVIQNFKS